MLRPLAVDLEHLASVLEGDPSEGGGRIDLKTGELWPYSPNYLFGDEETRTTRTVGSMSKPKGDVPLELFIATVEDPDIADHLQIAIDGRGAFRRFKDVLSRWPDGLERYFQFSSERQRGRARAWFAQRGYFSHGRPV